MSCDAHSMKLGAYSVHPTQLNSTARKHVKYVTVRVYANCLRIAKKNRERGKNQVREKREKKETETVNLLSIAKRLKLVTAFLTH